MTIIVSEETGKISVAYGGELERAIDSDRLRERLREIQDKRVEEAPIKYLARKAKVKK